jgi:hypothetical protein
MAEPSTLHMGPADFCETLVAIYNTTRHFISQDLIHERSLYFPAECSPSGVCKGHCVYFEVGSETLFFKLISVRQLDAGLTSEA